MKIGDLVISKRLNVTCGDIFKVIETFDKCSKQAIKIDSIISSYQPDILFWEQDFRLASPEEISELIAKKMLQ